MMRRFFSTVNKTIVKNEVNKVTAQHVLRTNNNNYWRNLDWMQQQIKSVESNNSYEKCDTAKLDAAMKKAQDKEVYSYYNR